MGLGSNRMVRGVCFAPGGRVDEPLSTISESLSAEVGDGEGTSKTAPVRDGSYNGPEDARNGDYIENRSTLESSDNPPAPEMAQALATGGPGSDNGMIYSREVQKQNPGTNDVVYYRHPQQSSPSHSHEAAGSNEAVATAQPADEQKQQKHDAKKWKCGSIPGAAALGTALVGMGAWVAGSSAKEMAETGAEAMTEAGLSAGSGFAGAVSALVSPILIVGGAGYKMGKDIWASCAANSKKEAGERQNGVYVAGKAALMSLGTAAFSAGNDAALGAAAGAAIGAPFAGVGAAPGAAFGCMTAMGAGSMRYARREGTDFSSMRPDSKEYRDHLKDHSSVKKVLGFVFGKIKELASGVYDELMAVISKTPESAEQKKVSVRRAIQSAGKNTSSGAKWLGDKAANLCNKDEVLEEEGPEATVQRGGAPGRDAAAPGAAASQLNPPNESPQPALQERAHTERQNGRNGRHPHPMASELQQPLHVPSSVTPQLEQKAKSKSWGDRFRGLFKRSSPPSILLPEAEQTQRLTREREALPRLRTEPVNTPPVSAPIHPMTDAEARSAFSRAHPGAAAGWQLPQQDQNGCYVVTGDTMARHQGHQRHQRHQVHQVHQVHAHTGVEHSRQAPSLWAPRVSQQNAQHNAAPVRTA